MADFTVRVELRGSRIDGDEYVRLHGLMSVEGFNREIDLKVRHSVGSNWVPHGGTPPAAPHPLPHATYFGQFDQDASTLLRHLVSKITSEVQPEIVVLIAQTTDYAIYP